MRAEDIVTILRIMRMINYMIEYVENQYFRDIINEESKNDLLLLHYMMWILIRIHIVIRI